MIKLAVINPNNGSIGENFEAQTFTKSGSSVLQYFNPLEDKIEFSHPEFDDLDFVPDFIQHSSALNFAYLMPA